MSVLWEKVQQAELAQGTSPHWRRKLSGSRMQMMPPPPVPPVWQREGAHQQHVFAGTAAGAAAAGAAGVEAMRRASDGDLLTGPSGGKEAKYDCPFCGKKFNRPSSLKVRTVVALACRAWPVPIGAAAVGSCIWRRLTPRLYPSLLSFSQIHTYSHTGEKPFSCSHPQCGRKFSVQSNLK